MVGKIIMDSSRKYLGANKKRWPRRAAVKVAREICLRLEPHCERLVVAGSLRRRRRDVGDVEILYIPRTETREVDLFATREVSLAGEEIDRMLDDGTIEKRMSVVGTPSWGSVNRLAVHVASGIPVDLFRTSRESWWNYLVCRTGPAASNMRIAEEARRRGYKWRPYGAGFTRLSDGVEVVMESEEQVFAFVGMDYWPPRER